MIGQIDIAESATQKEQQATLHAQELLSQELAARGVKLLEEGNSLGLLDLLQARRVVEHIPKVRESRASLWAGWYQLCIGWLTQAVGYGEGLFSVRGMLYVRGLPFVIELSPDGKLLATISDDKTVQLWNIATGQPTANCYDMKIRLML